ncbi:MAG: UDP-3-O-(3-hydroxymyristoyl)glucosamine N-acyltransferase [Bacteroidaceae bacterium]|nr:UDP-3-O-(3-hydroxymyristoyl)glucosamine N-acyltransferase [Bacteroidaceae bacterium]
MVFTAQQIAAYTGGTVEGDENVTVSTFAKIEEGTKGALSFLANLQYEHYIYDTESSVVLVNKDFKPSRPVKATLVRVDNAYESVAKLLQLYQSMEQKRTGIDSLAYIAPTAKIGKDVYIAPFAVVGDNAVIGDGCQLHPHATVGENAKVGENTIMYSNSVVYHDCIIGNNCILHAGCVIGADGFGFAPTPEGYEKIPQIGIVTIEDNVEIGANTCIDRSTMGSTYVRKGVKLDNLVQIAHNVEVGAHTVMSAQSGIAGSTKVGQWCMFGGQVGIVGHLHIGDKVYCGGKTGITGDKIAKKGNVSFMGYPGVEPREFAKQSAALKQLPDLLKEMQVLKREIEELKNNK